jgi:hypothetical protein
MAAPQTQFKAIANNLATTAVDTAGERKTVAAAGTTVDNSGSNPWDFGTVSIAGASSPVRSALKHLMWHVTAWGSNIAVSNFRAWFDSSPEGWGFDNVGTLFRVVPLKYQTGTNGTWATLPHQDAPPSRNLYAGDGDVGFGSGDDDVVGMQALLEVDELETAGVYQGATAGYEFRLSVRFDYN